MSSKIVMYRTQFCPFCVAASEFLKSRGVEAEEISLDDHPDRRGLTNSILPGHYTVPLIVIGDRPIGGMQELQALDQSGQLDELLAG